MLTDLFCGIILITEFHLSRLMTQMRLAVKMYLPAARNHHLQIFLFSYLWKFSIYKYAN